MSVSVRQTLTVLLRVRNMHFDCHSLRAKLIHPSVWMVHILINLFPLPCPPLPILPTPHPLLLDIRPHHHARRTRPYPDLPYHVIHCPVLPCPPSSTRPFLICAIPIRSRSGASSRGQAFEAPVYQEDDLSEETIAALISQLELAEATEVFK
jgi:hypothetical protein